MKVQANLIENRETKMVPSKKPWNHIEDQPFRISENVYRLQDPSVSSLHFVLPRRPCFLLLLRLLLLRSVLASSDISCHDMVCYWMVWWVSPWPSWAESRYQERRRLGPRGTTLPLSLPAYNLEASTKTSERARKMTCSASPPAVTSLTAYRGTQVFANLSDVVRPFLVLWGKKNTECPLWPYKVSVTEN